MDLFNFLPSFGSRKPKRGAQSPKLGSRREPNFVSKAWKIGW